MGERMEIFLSGTAIGAATIGAFIGLFVVVSGFLGGTIPGWSVPLMVAAVSVALGLAAVAVCRD